MQGSDGRTAVLDMLVAAAHDVTVEEFRLADFRCEQDAALGRQLLYLLSNTEWIRRTTEQVELGRVRAVDTEVVVDVDLSYLPRAVLDDGVSWLPILMVPLSLGDVGPGDPLTSMEVTDAAGARISKAPQSQVHRQVAAAVAELVLTRLPGGWSGGTPGRRDEQVLLTAALSRLLPGTGGHDGDAALDEPDGTAMLDRGRARVEERLHDARTGLLAAVTADLARPRPVLASRLMDMIAALVGSVYAVVPVGDVDGPTSFAVRLPGRRLDQVRRRRFSTAARAHLRVDLYQASGHSDRVVHLALPDGMAVSRSHDPGTSLAGARIQVRDVRPAEELRALMGLVLPDQEPDGAGAPSWTRRRLAGLAVDKVEATLEALQHLRAADGSQNPTARLRVLRALLLEVAAATDADPVATLGVAWDGGSWLPTAFERRLVVNTATPLLVHVRAAAIEGSAKAATTGQAAVDVDVEVADSTVLDSARDTSSINVALLALVTGFLLVTRAVDLQILATVLTLFPAIQASRVERPDRSTLRGVLAAPTYLLSLATAFPPVLLAAAFALEAQDPWVLALTALAAQVTLHLVLRRPGRPGGEPALLLTTGRRPDLARLDVLRGTWCRTLLADALFLGRLTEGWLVAAPDTPDALGAALDTTLGATDAEGAVTSLHGLFHATAAGRSATFVLARARGDEAPHQEAAVAATQAVVRRVDVDPGRLAAVEPPAWIVEAFVGLAPRRLTALAVADHPVRALLDAARSDDLPVLLVQQPALPPTYARERRDWMRIRVGVPFLPGEDLGRLRRYLDALDALRADHPARGTARVHVYAVPEFATHQASQTAPDETDRSREREGVVRDISPADVAAARDGRSTAAVAVSAPARIDLAADILDAAAALPCRVVAMTSVVLHGLAALMLVVEPRAGTVAQVTQDPSGALAIVVRAALEPPDVVQPLRAVASPAAAQDGSVARLQVRLPERPLALRALLHDVAEALDGLDTWFALFRVADGRSVQGRLMARVPRTVADLVRGDPDATSVQLAAAAQRRSAAHGSGPCMRRPAVEDDVVVDLGVLRTTAP